MTSFWETLIGFLGTPIGSGLRPKSKITSSGVPVTRAKLQYRAGASLSSHWRVCGAWASLPAAGTGVGAAPDCVGEPAVPCPSPPCPGCLFGSAMLCLLNGERIGHRSDQTKLSYETLA